MADTLVNSVKKALGILDILTFDDYRKKGIGLFDLSRKTGIKPNTLHNLLKTMVVCGYVSQNEESKYVSGPKCSSIGMMNRLASGSPLLAKIEDLMKNLSEKLKESVVFTILAEGNRVTLISVEHDNPIKIDTSLLEDDHIFDKVTGRILAAYSDDYNQKRIIELRGFPGEQWNGITDWDAFNSALKEIRQKGYSERSEADGSVISIAVPVLEKEEKLVGALGSYAPAFRCNEQKQAFMLDEMQRVAESIKKVL